MALLADVACVSGFLTSTLVGFLTKGMVAVVNRLHSELAARGVPGDTSLLVAAAMRGGHPVADSFDRTVVDALGAPCTTGVHTGLTVIAVPLRSGSGRWW